MRSLQLPVGVQDRVLDDNLFSKQRVEKVFPSLVGEKWKTSVRELSKDSELNYEKMVEFNLQVVKARNHFLHRGNKWAIPESMTDSDTRKYGSCVSLQG